MYSTYRTRYSSGSHCQLLFIFNFLPITIKAPRNPFFSSLFPLVEMSCFDEETPFCFKVSLGCCEQSCKLSSLGAAHMECELSMEVSLSS